MWRQKSAESWGLSCVERTCITSMSRLWCDHFFHLNMPVHSHSVTLQNGVVSLLTQMKEDKHPGAVVAAEAIGAALESIAPFPGGTHAFKIEYLKKLDQSIDRWGGQLHHLIVHCV
jgi:hypothetical protein